MKPTFWSWVLGGVLLGSWAALYRPWRFATADNRTSCSWDILFCFRFEPLKKEKGGTAH